MENNNEKKVKKLTLIDNVNNKQNENLKNNQVNQNNQKKEKNVKKQNSNNNQNQTKNDKKPKKNEIVEVKKNELAENFSLGKKINIKKKYIGEGSKITNSKKDLEPEKQIPMIKTNSNYIEKMTAKNRHFLEHYHPSKDKKIKIIPLGGLEEIGMNITVFEDEENIVIVDCGVQFPTEDLLGIDLVIPDITYLKQNKEKIRGFVFTHGHEDHIGAIPYIIKELNVPLFGTRLTMALIEGKLREHKIAGVQINEVSFGDIIKLGDMYVEFIKTNHSIVDSCALAIYTKAGIIMHTGDFKVDYTPVFGDAIDLKHFAEIGRMGVLALLSDSTNATKTGFTMSERVVGKVFDSIFNEHQKERIIVATFASNVDRVRQVIDTASRYDRKVAIEGRSMLNIINIAIELGYITLKKGILVETEMLKNYPPEKTVIITTGSQGESMAALSRMANGTHKKISIKAGDVVVLSSTPIPGNEKAVVRIINELARKHAQIINHDTHVSGHACQEEIKLIYTLCSPEFAIPIHGEYRHRLAATGLAESVGVNKNKCLMLDVGDVLELSQGKATVTGKVQSGGVYVDGLGVGDVGSIILKDRQALANSGILIIAMSLSHLTSEVMSGPDIISKGFIFIKDSPELVEGIKSVVLKCVEIERRTGETDWKKIKNEINSQVSVYLWKSIKRQPLIITIIMNV